MLPIFLLKKRKAYQFSILKRQGPNKKAFKTSLMVAIFHLEHNLPALTDRLFRRVNLQVELLIGRAGAVELVGQVRALVLPVAHEPLRNALQRKWLFVRMGIEDIHKLLYLFLRQNNRLVEI